MSDSFTYFGGIDFSGAKEPLSNLWTAVGREEDGKLLVLALRPHAFRADLCSYVAEGWRGSVSAHEADRVLWGADFPCGLPAAAARHLLDGERGGGGWEAMLRWVADRPSDEVRDAVPDGLRSARATDQGAGGMNPFDIRLYRQTVEGLRWLQQLREVAEIGVLPQAPDPGAPAALLEVYPSATAKDLGFKWGRTPRRPGEVRARAAAMRTYLRFAHPGDEAIAVCLEDAWDATLACLTAFLARTDLDQPFRTGTLPRETLELEGWIYRPPAAVG